MKRKEKWQRRTEPGGLLDLDEQELQVAPGPRVAMEGLGEEWEIRTTGTFGRVVGPHLGAVRAQVSMGVLEPGNGTVT